MIKRIVFIVCLLLGTCLMDQPAQAQCSMCSLNAEQATQNGNTQGKGLNNGIMYLLAIPYLLVGGVGAIWYRNYRKRNT